MLKALYKLVLVTLLLLAASAPAHASTNLKLAWPPAGWGAIAWTDCAPLTSCVRVAYFSVKEDAPQSTISHAYFGIRDDCPLDVFHAYAVTSSAAVISELGLASVSHTDYFGVPWDAAVRIAQRTIGGGVTLYYRVDVWWDAPFSQFDGCEYAAEVLPASDPTHADIWPIDNQAFYTTNL